MPDSESRACQNCKTSFLIDASDFDFYKKIDVPPPTWCPDCRNMRRFAWREERTLYKDACKLCGKATVSVHYPGGPFTIYCRDCWKSDKWDPMDYGREYDFEKPFFSQYRSLMEAVPRPALTGESIVNSDYSHACLSCKNCYYTFWSYFSEDSQYCYALLLSKNVYDSFVTDNSDHAYETLHSNRLYKVRFGYFLDECLDSAFLFDCVGCSDCFGCINLRKKKYCVFNEQLSREEYRKAMEYWDLGSYARLEEARKKFRTLYLSTPHRYAHVLNSQNVTGDIIRDTKNCHTCFSALDGVQDCKYLYFGGLNIKDSYDVSAGGDTSELLYEIFAVTRAQRVLLSAGSDGNDSMYCNWVRSASHLFGCIGLHFKKYCILNKQYSREEYEALIQKIRKHMDDMPYVDSRGRVYRYGEFFPMEISAYAYNESWAAPWYPKPKEQVLAEGLIWREPHERSYTISISPRDLPDHIRDVKDSILEETIGCLHEGKCNEECATAFRITKEELEFYRSMNIALPRFCPNCRYRQLLTWRNGFRLFHRECMCGGKKSSGRDGEYENVVAHFHGANACPNKIDTTFAEGNPAIVYCGDCYKEEFL